MGIPKQQIPRCTACTTAQKTAMFIVVHVALAALAAQACKVVLESIHQSSIAWGSFFLPGGMPSSHSAAVTALVLFVMASDGLDSSSTAIAATVWGFVIYDAMVTRWQLGLHAAVLNTELL